jgi:hypothetical protein
MGIAGDAGTGRRLSTQFHGELLLSGCVGTGAVQTLRTGSQSDSRT